MKHTSVEMLGLVNEGHSLVEVGAMNGIGYQAVYERLKRIGWVKKSVRHPLDHRIMSKIGARSGKRADVSHEVGEKIAANQAKHGGTLWETVDRLLS